MKQGWTYRQLGDICEILDSKRKPITKGKREPGSIPYYGATGCLDYVKDYIFDEKLVLLGEDGAKWGSGESSAYIISGKSWVNNHAHALRPKREIILDEILVYYLNYSNLQAFITGVTVPKLNQEKMRSIEVPVAPIDEQERIVERLDAAFAQIDELKSNAERQLAEARALFQSALTQAMQPKPGWQEKTFIDVFDDITDFVAAGSFADLRKNVVYNSEPDFAQLIRTTDLKNRFNNKSFVYVNEHAFKYLWRVNLNEECIILPNVGVNCGEVYYLHPSMLKHVNNVLGPNAILVRSRKVNNRFLAYYLQGVDFQKEIKHITSSMAQPKYNKTNLKTRIVHYPSANEQKALVAYLDSLSNRKSELEEISRKTTAECDALKQALLRQIFE